MANFKKMNYFILFYYICVSIYTTRISAHTWIESVNLIGPDDKFQDTGYARGYTGRTVGISPDDINTHLLPPNGRNTNEILSSDLMCKYKQTKKKPSSKFPRLSASPNDRISLTYHENGHVTKFKIDKGKPAGRGTVFIYGTKRSSPNDTYLAIHRVWNAQGTGGNGRGKLLATRPFDDGQCYQNNDEEITQNRAQKLGFENVQESPEVQCQSILSLPSDAGNNGTYTLYWVWEWPTLNESGEIFKNESYTSCIDIDMMKKNKTTSSRKTLNTESSDSEVSVNSVALKSQLEEKNQFLVDPRAPPQIASDNPPSEHATSSPTKTNSAHKKSEKGSKHAHNYKRGLTRASSWRA